MASPASPSDSGVQDSVGTDPRMLMAQEFLLLTVFIAGLLDDLTDAPPDWCAADTRIEMLQRLATVREQLVRGVALNLTIAAGMQDEMGDRGRPIGFSSSQNRPPDGDQQATPHCGPGASSGLAAPVRVRNAPRMRS